MSSEIKNITQLAKQLAEKELANPSPLESKEMLDALEEVAKLLGKKAGSNTQIKELAGQVQALVQSKRSS
jgi:hypothetical protein